MNADALIFSEFGRREGAPLSRRSKSYPRDLVVKCTRLRLFATSLTTPGHVKGLGVVGFYDFVHTYPVSADGLSPFERVTIFVR